MILLCSYFENKLVVAKFTHKFIVERLLILSNRLSLSIEEMQIVPTRAIKSIRKFFGKSVLF